MAHSTTQATNALIEGDVAHVGVVGVGPKGIGGWIAKIQTNMKDINLGSGRFIRLHNRFICDEKLSDELVTDTIRSLVDEGAEVVVASESYGVDDMENETGICKIAKDMGLEATAASEITKLYGLTRRTRTAAINASILPKMLNTANSTESSVRSAGVEVPLMIMRGDGGVMEISEMKKRPVLTMLSGPAASVMGSLMYLRASNGVYFEVGGTTTNIGVIKDGRPAIDYSVVGGHRTYISSLDVRVLGVAGGSMVRADKSGVKDVGPRSAHIAGMDYAVFTPEEEIVDPKVVFFSPKEGDPDDYVAIELKNGKRITITNTCAANVLGLIKPEYFAYGNANAARKAMQPLADYMGKTVEEVATQILTRAYEKIEPIIMDLAEKYRLEKDQISLVGVGGGAAALIGFCSDSGWGRWSGPFAAENRCIPFLLGQARPASVRLAATQTERTPAFPPLQWARPAAWPAASEKYSRLSSTWAAEHLPGAPVLPGTRGRCGTPGLHQTRSRPGRYTAGSEAHRLHRPEGRGQHPAARERTSRVPGLAWHPAAPGSDTGQRDLPW